MIDAIVTGGSGFIGGKLVGALKNRGQEVLALSSADGDIAESQFWQRVPATQVLFHLAGRSYVPDSWENSASFLQANLIGVEHALTYCQRTGARFVLASAYVYGIPSELPIKETSHASPNNPYALSKLMAEELAAFAAQYRDVSVSVLRLFNVYGQGQRQEFLIPSIVQQIKSGSAITVRDLVPKRDYVHVSDVVEAFILAARNEGAYRCFNIGSGTSYSVWEIIEMIQRVAGTRYAVLSDKLPRRHEILDVCADITLAREVLGWAPQYSLEEGLREMYFSK